MNFRTLVNISLASSLMLLAGSSLAMGPGDQDCGAGCGGGDCGVANMQSTPVVSLSEHQAKELIKMREEEKVARDVYTSLGEKWNADVFKIANAESRHMMAMKKMLDRFGIQDPITDNTPGVYTSEAFTKLHENLIEAGSDSLLDALKVGAKIEELDLVDLGVAAQGVEDPILNMVYGKLQRATRNHLRAFAKQIQANGGTYEAEFLTQEEFDAIANSPMEKGMGAQAKGKGKAKGQGKGQGKKAGKDCGLCDG